jgi:hypothetical protein
VGGPISELGALRSDEGGPLDTTVCNMAFLFTFHSQKAVS